MITVDTLTAKQKDRCILSLIMNVKLYRYLVCVIIFKTIYAAEKGEKCTTPHGKKGTCVSLFSCELIYRAVPSTNNRTREFVLKYECGNDGETLVCCESPNFVNLGYYQSNALADQNTCGVKRETPRIIGGTKTLIDEFPWVAALEYKSRKKPFTNQGIKCAGSVISKRYVLTAASCLVSFELELVRVWVGDWQISTDPDCVGVPSNVECALPVQKLRIREIIVHLFFSKIYATNNIGLIGLEDEIEFTDFVRPICLPPPHAESPEVESILISTGWGATENGVASDIKLKVELPLLNNSVCNAALRRGKNLSTHEMCAGGEAGKDTCPGDSGGPLMRSYQKNTSEHVQWYQEGITSWGTGCGHVGYPAVYTRVADYMQWITSVIS